MNVWLFLLLMCGLLIAAVFILFWHPQRSRTKTSTSDTGTIVVAIR